MKSNGIRLLPLLLLQLTAALRVASLKRLRDQVGKTGAATKLNAKRLEAVRSYLNENHASDLLAWTLRHTEVGETARSKNAWSRGLWTPTAARLTAIDGESLSIAVDVAQRGQADPEVVETTLCLPASLEGCTLCDSVEELRNALLRLAVEGKMPESCPSLLRLPGAEDNWSLPDSMWLNNMPNTHSVRQLFYGDASLAVRAAIADESCPRRMLVTVTPPELNMQYDS
jgi:hypothetical protein